LYALLDTGCLSHFVTSAIDSISSPTSPTLITQPDGSQLVSTQTTTIPLPTKSLTVSSTTAHIVPTLTQPLLSIRQFCDAGSVAVFTKDSAHILHGRRSTHRLQSMPTDAAFITGDRDSHDTLWHTPLHHLTEQQTCHTLRYSSTISQRISYYHACLGSPTLSTWCEAIDAGHLTTFPALTTSQVRKYFPNTIATYMGHLDQDRQQQYSTKVYPDSSRDLYLGIADSLEAPTIPHRPGTIYSDPTGRFITTSSQGNTYILIVFDTDSNYIFAEPMPSCSAHQILKAYDKCHCLLVSRGITPHVHVLDNEVSTL